MTTTHASMDAAVQAVAQLVAQATKKSGLGAEPESRDRESGYVHDPPGARQGPGRDDDQEEVTTYHRGTLAGVR